MFWFGLCVAPFQHRVANWININLNSIGHLHYHLPLLHYDCFGAVLDRYRWATQYGTLALLNQTLHPYRVVPIRCPTRYSESNQRPHTNCGYLSRQTPVFISYIWLGTLCYWVQLAARPCLSNHTNTSCSETRPNIVVLPIGLISR